MSKELFEIQQVVGSCAFDLGNWVGIIEKMIPDDAVVGNLVKVNKQQVVEHLKDMAIRLGEASRKMREYYE